MSLERVKKNNPNASGLVDEFADSLSSLLPQVDFLVLSLPLTPTTKGMIGRDELKLMKKSAVIINVGRGAVIDEDAMVERLKEGELGGAGLDVFSVEPLPESSPLWELPNVLISPHTADNCNSWFEGVFDNFITNLSLFVDDQPLRFVVDKENGY
eukprot:TRINITY_DN3278_c0_g3_i5.p2 TRINITY_DN3278_c0_g3~~TRINITY_DN3278_c0_g3_i5.p2  ORF type:complete len:155 (+),score=56.00 TRINITY_DN3278_c0_g3_i5:678-1142(+)